MVQDQTAPRIYGLVPARGGSRRLPGKNLRPLAGRPMIDYTFDAAVTAGCLAKVILSTDDPEIARCARRFGVSTPFLRPAALASDDADVTDVILHTLDFLAYLNAFNGGDGSADCSGDGTVNTLDFLCFLNHWAQDELEADCNGDGTLNSLDFTCFLNEWVACRE